MITLKLLVETDVEQQELGEELLWHRFELLMPLPPLMFLESRFGELAERCEPMLAIMPWPAIHRQEAEESEALEDLREQTLK